MSELDQIMDKMQKDEISRLLNIIKERDADIEGLRKALERIADEIAEKALGEDA